MDKLEKFINITNGKHNTQDCIDDGLYPFFDRSDVIKHSNNYLFDAAAIIFPGEGTSFVPKFYSGKFDLHQRCYAITPNNNMLIPKYLYYFLYFHQDYFRRVATGSTVKSLRLAHFLDMPVLFHNLAMQNHIVDTILLHLFF